MKFAAALALLAVSAFGKAAQGFTQNVHPRSYYEARFYDWMAEYDVTFEDGEEFVKRLQNFADADDYINAHNDKAHNFDLAHNAFSHLSWDEFKSEKGIGRPMLKVPNKPMSIPAQGQPQVERRALEDLPASVDWTKNGAVTAVKDQGACGSCWAFSTTGAMEGAYYLKKHNLVSFSEQELVDCDSYDSGCNGGLMDFSFHWIQQNKGICKEEDYSYVAVGGICNKYACQNVDGSAVKEWVDVKQYDEKALMEAVSMQPVSIAIEADQMSFQFYNSGVMTEACGTNLDHGVLLVGYGTDENGVDYWKVKNSWGGSWGADGYILLARGKESEGGQCGILLSASYPELE